MIKPKIIYMLLFFQLLFWNNTYCYSKTDPLETKIEEIKIRLESLSDQYKTEDSPRKKEKIENKILGLKSSLYNALNLKKQRLLKDINKKLNVELVPNEKVFLARDYLDIHLSDLGAQSCNRNYKCCRMKAENFIFSTPHIPSYITEIIFFPTKHNPDWLNKNYSMFKN